MAAVEELKTGRSANYPRVKSSYEHLIGGCRPATASHNHYDQRKRDRALIASVAGHTSRSKSGPRRAKCSTRLRLPSKAREVESLDCEWDSSTSFIASNCMTGVQSVCGG
jgi:hypothetical protein